MEKSSGKQNKWGVIDMREIEENVDAEAREWARRRKEEVLREKTAAFSPGRRKSAESRSAPRVKD